MLRCMLEMLKVGCHVVGGGRDELTAAPGAWLACLRCVRDIATRLVSTSQTKLPKAQTTCIAEDRAIALPPCRSAEVNSNGDMCKRERE